VPEDVSYPGVYVQEIPSGVRAIGGVSTSIAAFAGWAPQGPNDRAVLCLSLSAFNRIFGGFDARGYFSYAVSQFFANGGTHCYAIRLTGPKDVTATAAIDGLELSAIGPGAWANAYQLVANPRSDDATRFRLDVVVRAANAVAESYQNLSQDPGDSRYVKSVLANESEIIVATKTDATRPVTGKTVDLGSGTKGDDGPVLVPSDADFDSALMGDGASTGVYYLDKVDLFNLLNVPGYANITNLGKLETFCKTKRAILLIDSDKGTSPTDAVMTGAPAPALTGEDGRNAAFYYPWVLVADPEQEGHIRPFPPCGSVAGVYARTDAARGVWKAPAGTEASLTGVSGLTKPITEKENGVLNPLAVNCIRQFTAGGTVVWGARTLRGINDEWKYVPVRRTALYIEESLQRGLQWVVFEPNGEPLWAQIRLSISAFMQDLFRRGAFQGSTPQVAYFVKCDEDTTTQSDIDRGVVNILVGFAPLKPAEFVLIQIQKMAGRPIV
jgi:phage tail sheath protein FI